MSYGRYGRRCPQCGWAVYSATPALLERDLNLHAEQRHPNVPDAADDHPHTAPGDSPAAP